MDKERKSATEVFQRPAVVDKESVDLAAVHRLAAAERRQLGWEALEAAADEAYASMAQMRSNWTESASALERLRVTLLNFFDGTQAHATAAALSSLGNAIRACHATDGAKLVRESAAELAARFGEFFPNAIATQSPDATHALHLLRGDAGAIVRIAYENAAAIDGINELSADDLMDVAAKPRLDAREDGDESPPEDDDESPADDDESPEDGDESPAATASTPARAKPSTNKSKKKSV